MSKIRIEETENGYAAYIDGELVRMGCALDAMAAQNASLVAEVYQLRKALKEREDGGYAIYIDDQLVGQFGSPEIGMTFHAWSIEENHRLQKALDESLKLQSHYAGLLNGYDGGERMTFPTVDDWIRRLEGCGVLEKQERHGKHIPAEEPCDE